MAALLDINRVALTGVVVKSFNVTGERSAIEWLEQHAEAATRFGQSVEVGFSPERQQASITLHVKCEVHVGTPLQPTGTAGSFTFVFRYEIENLSALLVEVPKAPYPVMRYDLVALLTSTSYSTARGILLTRLAGTALDNVILPIIDVQDLLRTSAAGEEQ